MSKIKNWYKGLSNPVRAALNTAWQSFVATFGLALLGLISRISEWADGGADFPTLEPVAKGFVSAAVAAVAFLVTYVVRTVQAKSDPLKVPQYSQE